jgi:hypothetical protein
MAALQQQALQLQMITQHLQKNHAAAACHGSH